LDEQAWYALVKQDLERLLSIRDPAAVGDWHPSDQQRSAYVDLLQRILNYVDNIESALRRRILSEASTRHYVPDGLLDYYRGQVKLRLDALKSAYAKLDPDGFSLHDLLEGLLAPRGGQGRVKTTFEVAVERMYDLIENNPEFEGDFLPDSAFEIINSKLIVFDPDSWPDRAGALSPVRTNRKNAELPAHARFRLIEIYRSYVFGNWLSVLALARSILEYVILDNLHKLQIDPRWPTVDETGSGKKKKLTHLIDEVGNHLPHIRQEMHRLREYGNDYLHPEKTNVSKETLFQREQAAKQAIELLTKVVEELYLARKAEV
jgi:hypothetical protein